MFCLDNIYTITHNSLKKKTSPQYPSYLFHFSCTDLGHEFRRFRSVADATAPFKPNNSSCCPHCHHWAWLRFGSCVDLNIRPWWLSWAASGLVHYTQEMTNAQSESLSLSLSLSLLGWVAFLQALNLIHLLFNTVFLQCSLPCPHKKAGFSGVSLKTITLYQIFSIPTYCECQSMLTIWAWDLGRKFP